LRTRVDIVLVNYVDLSVRKVMAITSGIMNCGNGCRFYFGRHSTLGMVDKRAGPSIQIKQSIGSRQICPSVPGSAR